MAKIKTKNPEVLELENEVLKEENTRLSAIVAKKEAATPSVHGGFQYDGVEYILVVAAFQHESKRVTAAEVEADAEMQKHLIETESPFIKIIE